MTRARFTACALALCFSAAALAADSRGKAALSEFDGMDAADRIEVIDANRGGSLSAAEDAARSRAKFAKMDMNNDGYLTREEWIAGHAALTGQSALNDCMSGRVC